MDAYAKEVKELARLCALCEGKCCLGSKLSVSSKELARLSKHHKFESAVLSSKDGSLNVILFEDGKCPFLGEKNGLVRCILSVKNRPLSCRLFPLTFRYEEGKLEFYASSYCPYQKEAVKLSGWARKAMEDARGELEGWEEGEKRFRSKFHEKIHRKKEGE